MARTFRQRRQMHAVAELNVTNMLDLAFVLLIIFMIATPLITAEQTIPINLPSESKSPQKPDPDATFQSISINRQGTYYFGDTPVTLADLQSRLRQLATESRPPVIRIRADSLAAKNMRDVVVHDVNKKPPGFVPGGESII